jgi:hypothetical protein
MENEKSVYSKISDIIKESNYYHSLSDKTELFTTTNKRIVTTYSITRVSVRFANLFNLDMDLVEVIACARDLGYPPYGQLGESILKKKYSNFNKVDCSIEILKSLIEDYNKVSGNNIEIPENLINGIKGSFAIGESKEGQLIYLVENIYEIGKISGNPETPLDQKIQDEYIENIDFLWHKFMEKTEVTNKTISENILKFSETYIAELGA